MDIIHSSRTIPPDVVLLFSYIRGILSIVRFYWGGSTTLGGLSMSGQKGMKKYPMGIREEVVTRIRAGENQRALSQEYGISRWAIQSWLKEPVLPKARGRKPAKTLAEYKYENKRLKMENELLRDFLCSIERK